MIVQFFRYGNGMSKGPLNYLLGKDRKRDHAKILTGNEQEVAALIDSSPFAKKYTTGCLSFYEHDLSQQQKQKIMADFESCLFPGMSDSQYRVLWIEHQDKENEETGQTRLELNFVIPNTEILTGQRLQPFFHTQDLSRVDLFKKIVNFEHSLHDPNDPLFRQPITSKKSLPSSVAEIKNTLDQEVLKAIESGLIRDRDSMKQWLIDLGLTITRETKKSISIENPSGDEKSRPIRLTGAVYEQNFRVTAESTELTRAASEEYRREARSRYESDIQRYATYLERKGTELERKYRQHEAEYTDSAEYSHSTDYRADKNRDQEDSGQTAAGVQRTPTITAAANGSAKSELERIKPLERANSTANEAEKSAFYIEYSIDFNSSYNSYQQHLLRLRQQQQVQRHKRDAESSRLFEAARREHDNNELRREIVCRVRSEIFADEVRAGRWDKTAWDSQGGTLNESRIAVIENYRRTAAAITRTTIAIEAASAELRHDAEQNYGSIVIAITSNAQRSQQLRTDAKSIINSSEAISRAGEKYRHVYRENQWQSSANEPDRSRPRQHARENLDRTELTIVGLRESSTELARNFRDIEKNIVQMSKPKNEVEKPRPKQEQEQDRGMDFGM